HREKIVFIENIEGNIFRCRKIVRRLRRPHGDSVAVADLVTSLGVTAVDLHASGVDDFLDNRSAIVWKNADHVLVETGAFNPHLSDDLDRISFGGGKGNGGLHRAAIFSKWRLCFSICLWVRLAGLIQRRSPRSFAGWPRFPRGVHRPAWQRRPS